MEYVDGRSFHEIVTARGPLAFQRAAHYIAQAAVGLQHAHERGLIHRDIKPANILLDRQGVVKILDLGLARFFKDDTDDLTRMHGAKNVLGTADFVSPEQALDSHGADDRTDIYSLGCTFYYLLTGVPPFAEAKSLGQKLMAHQTEIPPAVRKLRPEVPAELAVVLEKMMAKKKEERYQTPSDVFEALEPWTREPIDLPSEDEMPQFCPAVQAAGSTITSKNLTPSAVNIDSKVRLVRSGATPTPTPGRPSSRVPTLPKTPGNPLHLWVAVGIAILVAGVCGFLLK
jgi:serine/threonine protein kinase